MPIDLDVGKGLAGGVALYGRKPGPRVVAI